ncbi:FRG domain-containing protein [Enterobacter chuandaensis]|uniref:FRG domain-containing protein n=1 Tax=Enterobacter cloacae complex TaxID=354276 RepID=UPI001E289C9F|nr:FRG domain-containing protein [Enterobacter cloacae]MCE1396107.1 FRG domain-containing protein [Enterobacter cloacae]
MNKAKVETESHEEACLTVADYIDFILQWKDAGRSPTAFRGQANMKWIIEPKLFRKDVAIYDNEDNAIRDVISLEPAEFSNDKTMFDKLVRMQHFGLPTRLLDVTTNPLIALWFATESIVLPGKEIDDAPQEQDGRIIAFYVPKERSKYYDSDTVSCLSHLASLRSDQKEELFELIDSVKEKRKFNISSVVKYLCYQIGMEKPHFKPLIIPRDLLYPLYVKPKLNNKRIIAQSGAFLLYGAKDYNPADRKNPIKAKYFKIPANSKLKIRDELAILGINERTLFPDIERATKFVTLRYQNELRSRQESLF